MHDLPYIHIYELNGTAATPLINKKLSYCWQTARRICSMSKRPMHTSRPFQTFHTSSSATLLSYPLHRDRNITSSAEIMRSTSW